MDSSLKTGEHDFADTLILGFWPPDSETVHLCCLSCPVCGHLLQWPQTLIPSLQNWILIPLVIILPGPVFLDIDRQL